MPNTVIIADAKEDETLEDSDSIECLLFKLILSLTLVREEGNMEKRRLGQDFWHAHTLFQSRDGEHEEG